jgi:hypothetical protein
MRQRSGDLFPTDSPLPASQLIGRGADVRETANALANGTHLVFAGPRRTGKTSVCEAALTRLEGKGFYVASVDLFRLADAAELAEELAVACVRNRSAAHRLAVKARQAGRAALSTVQASAVLKIKGELGEAAELAFTPGLAGRNPERSLDQALGLPERIAVADGRHMILFFDEFQEVASDRRPYGDPGALTKRMRAIFQRTSHVSYLFAGSIEHVMRDLFAPGQRAFSGFGSFHQLRTISAADWAKGLMVRFAADDCELKPSTMARIVELGEGHPRVTMLIAQQTHLVSVQLETRQIDLDTVQQGYEAAFEGDRARLEQTVERIRLLHRSALAVARRVAGAGPPTRKLHPGVQDRVLKLLQNAGIVEHPSRGDWRINDPLLRVYLQQLGPAV